MALPFTAYLDTELKVLHTDQGCPGLKVPSKYGYQKILVVANIETARELDREYKPCDKCKTAMTKAGKAMGPKKPYRRRQTGE